MSYVKCVSTSNYTDRHVLFSTKEWYICIASSSILFFNLKVFLGVDFSIWVGHSKIPLPWETLLSISETNRYVVSTLLSKGLHYMGHCIQASYTKAVLLFGWRRTRLNRARPDTGRLRTEQLLCIS